MNIVKIGENKYECTVTLYDGLEVRGYGKTEIESKINCQDHVHLIKMQLLRKQEEINEKLKSIQRIQRDELQVNAYDRSVAEGYFTGTPQEWSDYILRGIKPTEGGSF